jgi:hypothetical protein
LHLFFWRRPIATTFRLWHIAKFSSNARLGRYRGTAEIDQAALIKLDFISTSPCTNQVLAPSRWLAMTVDVADMIRTSKSPN